MTTETYFDTRAKAFSGQGVRTHRVSVDSDGTVRVYDNVAKHYTTCHALTERQQERIRREALS
jgi:hypothetical protein